jgi:hypothetical protein
MSATAIGIAQLNLVKTGKEQLKSVLGYLNKNDHSWETQFKGTVNLENLQVRMQQTFFIRQRFCGKMSFK